jgi:hypothetical protein
MSVPWLVAGRGFAFTLLALSLTGCCGQFFKGPHDLAGVSISPDGHTIKLGTTQQFSATGTFQDENGAKGDVTAQTTWTSSDPEIATIDTNGVATGVAFGTTTIKGSCECFSSKATLTVGTENIILSSITISPLDKRLITGTTQQFTATGKYSNDTTSDISSAVTWKSSDPGVATIDSRGGATAVSAGTTTISASSGGISGTTNLTVAIASTP